jgi:phosphoribosylformylglycinamidine synthase
VQIGVTSEEPVLDIHNEFTIGLDELRAAYTATMRNLFGAPAEGVNRLAAVVSEDAPGKAGEVTEVEAEGTGRSVTLEISEPAAEQHETASGPADEVAGLPARTEEERAEATPDEPETAQPDEPETAQPEDDKPQSKD